MELEALLLGLEPMTAAAVGIGALVLVPAVSVFDSITGQNLSESARGVAKTGLMWSLEVADKTQAVFAEATESVKDLIAEATAERSAPKSGNVAHEAVVG